MSYLAAVKTRKHSSRVGLEHLDEATPPFQMIFSPGPGDTVEMVLEERQIQGGSHLPQMVRVARSVPSHTRRIVGAVLDAARQSGHRSGVLSSKVPVPLSEAAGIRLSLIMLATAPITKARRTEEITAGIRAMGVEETYYWYSKCTGDLGAQGLRALRILLSED